MTTAKRGLSYKEKDLRNSKNNHEKSKYEHTRRELGTHDQIGHPLASLQ